MRCIFDHEEPVLAAICNGVNEVRCDQSANVNPYCASDPLASMGLLKHFERGHKSIRVHINIDRAGACVDDCCNCGKVRICRNSNGFAFYALAPQDDLECRGARAHAHCKAGSNIRRESLLKILGFWAEDELA